MRPLQKDVLGPPRTFMARYKIPEPFIPLSLARFFGLPGNLRLSFNESAGARAQKNAFNLAVLRKRIYKLRNM